MKIEERKKAGTSGWRQWLWGRRNQRHLWHNQTSSTAIKCVLLHFSSMPHLQHFTVVKGSKIWHSAFKDVGHYSCEQVLKNPLRLDVDMVYQYNFAVSRLSQKLTKSEYKTIQTKHQMLRRWSWARDNIPRMESWVLSVCQTVARRPSPSSSA